MYTPVSGDFMNTAWTDLINVTPEVVAAARESLVIGAN
jgi:hypothetical protein